MSTLTDRYVHEVARRLPEKQRKDIADELRATIADMAEDRPEREVLQELGDPAVLADKYRDRPRYLIGPELYPQFWKVLTTLLAVVPPILAALAFASTLAAGDHVGEAFGAAVGAAIQIAVQVAFWVTLVFAVIERSAHGKPLDTGEGGWTPDKLPDRAKGNQVGLGEFVAGMVVLAVSVAFLVGQHLHSPLQNAAGQAVPLLDPTLWPGWMAVLFTLIGAAAVVEFLKYRHGRWSYRLAALNGAVNLAFLAVLGGLSVAGRLVNPEFTSTVTDLSDSPDFGNFAHWVGVNAWIVIAVVFLWDTVEGFVKARRAAALDS